MRTGNRTLGFTVLMTLLAVSAVSARPASPDGAPSKIQLVGVDSGAKAAPGAVRGVFSAAAQDTTYFGGTFWASDSMRWEAIQDSVWTFDSGVGSNFNHSDPLVNPYKENSLHAYMEGWLGIDNTYSEVTYFRRVSTADFGGGTVCVGSPAGLEGSYSFWAGVFPAEANDLCWAGGAGYGDNWNVCIYQDFSYSGSGTVTLSYDYINDTEGGFDYTRVSVNGVEAAAYTGLAGGPETLLLDQLTYFPGGAGTYRFRFCVTSDGAWSDQDGLYDTSCGAFALDSISITGGGISHDATFEASADGWAVEPALPGSGEDWSNIIALGDLPPPLTECSCTLQDSVLVFQDSFGGHTFYQDNIAVSPWIDLRAAGLDGSPGKILDTDVYAELPLLNYMFAQVAIQWYPEICLGTGLTITSDFTSTGFVYYFGGVPSCTTSPDGPRRYDFSAIAPASAEQIRVAVGVLNYCQFYGNCSGVTNSTPWYDNIRFGVFGNPDAPILTVSPIDVPQDAFPEDGTLGISSPGRVDCNNVVGASNPQPFTSLGDSLVVDGASGAAEVRVVFAVDPGPGINSSALSSWLTSHTTENTWQGLTWYSARIDTSETGGSLAVGTWMTTYHEDDPNFTGTDTDLDPNDLDPNGRMTRLENDVFPDDILTPGSRLMLYYKTRYLSGSTWYFLPDTTGGIYYEMEVLPSSMASDTTWNNVLYVDHQNSAAATVNMETALGGVLTAGSQNFENTEWDRWDVEAPTSGQGSLGRPADTEYGASIPQVLGYDTIIYNTGNLGSFLVNTYDADVLTAFIALDPTVGKSLYMTGDNVAGDMTSTGGNPAALLNTFLGVNINCYTFRDFNCPTSTAQDTTSCIDVDPVGGAHFSSGTGTVASGNGCPLQRSFNVLDVNFSAEGDPQGNIAYNSSVKGIVNYESVSNWSQSEYTYKSVIDGVSTAWLRDTDCTGTTAIQTRLSDVLGWFGQTISTDTDGDYVPDATDDCAGVVPGFGEVDMDFDGCPDPESNLRFVKFRRWLNMPVYYETDADGDPRITDGSDFSELAAAFATWAAIPGANISGGDDGTRAGPSQVVTGDGRNSITFQDPDGWLPGVLAITPTTTVVADTVMYDRWYRTGEIVDADIMFNSSQFYFSTPTHPTPPGDFDLRSVAVHEFGHFFGFSHSSIPSSSMFYAVPRDTSARSLEMDDIVLANRGYKDGYVGATHAVFGHVFRGDGTTPIAGAAVYAISGTSGDTLQFTVTTTDGSYRFMDVNDFFRVWVQPLDGGPEVNGLQASAVNSEVAGIVETDFLPEWWDEVGESNSDTGSGFLILVSTATVADIIINTDTTAPTVVSTTPLDSATGVPATTTLAAKFDERLDRSYFASAPDIAFRDVDADTGIVGSAAVLQRDSLIVFTPQSSMRYMTNYRLTVGPDVRDISGNPMAAPVVVNFQTGPQPPVDLISATPNVVPEGGTLVLKGTGFSATATEDTVSFGGGVTAIPFAATLDRLFLTVPTGAMTGNLTAKVGSETSTTPLNLTVVPPKDPPAGNYLGNAALGGEPRNLAVSPDGSFVYVATSQGVAAVDAVPTSGTFLQVTQIVIPGGCTDVVTLPDGLRALAVCPDQPRLREINTDPTSGGSFHTLIGETGLADEPLGIAVVPGGGEVIIVYGSRAVLHSTETGAGLGQELKDWAPTGYGFLGDVAVSAGGEEAYAATTDGNFAFLGLGVTENIVAVLPGGVNPRGLAALPDGQRVLGVDKEGVIRTYAKRGPQLGTLALGGGYDGITASPEGSFAYAANLVSNRIDVLDLQGSTVKELVSFGTAVDPVDVITGSAGRYFYVASTFGDILEVFDTEGGPRITAVAPAAGGTNALLTVIGSGFNAIPANNDVSIGGVGHTPLRVGPGNTSLTVQQDASVVSGPVSVTVGGLTSNVSPLKVVNRPDPAGFALSRGFATGGPGPEQMALSSGGKLLIALHTDGSMTVTGTDRTQDTFHRTVLSLSSGETSISGGGDLFVLPDGTKLYAADPVANKIAVFDLDENSTSPVARAGTVVDAVGDATIQNAVIAATPDASRLLVTDTSANTLFEIATDSDSVIAAIGGFVSPTAVVAHPQGLVAYVADDADSVQAVDIDPASGAYRTTLATIGLPGSLDHTVQLVASRDGSKVVALTKSTDIVPIYAVSAINADSSSGTYHTVLGTLGAGSGTNDPAMAVNYSGTVLYLVDPNNGSELAYDLGTFTGLPAGPSAVAELGSAQDIVVSMDDARLYADGAGDTVLVTDLTPVESLSFIAGTQQTGVENELLPAPIVIRLSTSGDATLLEGSPVTLSSELSGGDFGLGDHVLFTAADAQGQIRAPYIVGPGAGEDTVLAQYAAGVGTLVFTVVGDTALASPEIVAVAPGTGSYPGVTTPIVVDFSKAIDQATVSTTSYIVRPQGGSAIAGYFAYTNEQRRVVFKAASPLAYDTTYEIELTSALEDNSGNPLSDPGVHSFITTTAPPLSVNAVQNATANAGDKVVISGQSFSDTESENTVLFEGLSAIAAKADPGAIVAYVPETAQTGLLQVVVGSDTSNAVPFKVYPAQINTINTVTNQVSVPSGGLGVAVVADGSRAYMTAPKANAVVPIVVSTWTAEPAIPVGLYPFGITASPSGDRLYVTNFFSNDVSVIDAVPSHSTFQDVIATISTGQNPTGVICNPDGRTLYVANYGDSTLSLIDTDSTSAKPYSGRASINTGTGSQSVTVTPDGGRIIVGTSYGLLLIDADDTSGRQSINTGTGTQAVTVTPDGGLAVVLGKNNYLTLIDIVPGSPTEGQGRASINTGTGSQSVTVSPDGGLAYVPNLSGYVAVYKIIQPGSTAALAGGNTSGTAFSFSVEDSIPVGENPTNVAFDPSGSGQMVVVNSGDATVDLVSATEAVGIREEPPAPTPVPITPKLYANMPNPFTRATTIRYDLAKATAVNISVFDIQGRLVRVVENSPLKPAGQYEVVWDGRNEFQQRTATGVYFYRLKTPDFHQSRKMVLLR